jgi:hypothetical protein
MGKNVKIILILLACNLSFRGQTFVYNVPAQYSTIPAAISAINAAAAATGGAGTYQLVISGPILLTTNPAPILMPSGRNMIITSGSSQAIIIPAFPVKHCFMISNGGSTASVIIQNIKFKDFNKYSYTNYPTCYPPICIWAEAADNVTIQSCIFENHFTAIRYDNNINNLIVQNNTFITDGLLPGPCALAGGNQQYNFGAIAQTALGQIPQSPATLRKTKIQGNTFTLSGPIPTEPYYDHGIYISPLDFVYVKYNTPPIIPAATNPNNDYSALADITITGNTMTGYLWGIYQDQIPALRTTIDQNYKLSITGNVLNNLGSNIVLNNPYRHFLVDYNTMNLLPINQANTDQFHLEIGSRYVVSLLPSSAVPTFNNRFGFDIVYPNTIGKTIANNNNIFSKSSGAIKANIFAGGDFGDKNLTVSNDGLNLVKMKYIGGVVVQGGRATSIRQCTLAASNIGFGQKPIAHDVNILNWSSEVKYGNGYIAAPVIQDAYVNGSIFNVAFDLTGSQIVQPNGPFVVEFYKSNANNDLTALLGSQNINVLTNQTYSLTFTLPANVTLTQGDRIGAHVTSIGTNNGRDPYGTSEVGFFDIPICTDCISDFAPEPGKTYIAGAWVKPGNAGGPQNGNYNAAIQLIFYGNAFVQTPATQIGSPVAISPSGPLSEGWQKIEGQIQVPSNAKSMKLQLMATPSTSGGNMLFDDIRFFPKDATMKSYAYDKSSMRLMAELDERNFATFYEYDEEGKLIRVKKETEKGIMTIKESRNSKPTR